MIAINENQWGVIGAGKTGAATAKWLLQQGAGVILVDDDSQKLGDVSKTMSGQISFRPTGSVLASDASGWIISPGIKPDHTLVKSVLERGCAYSDLDLWQKEHSALAIAVTGTNGKSSVTRLISTILSVAGFKTVEAGNIGTPVTSVMGQEFERIVLEVSSFQLYYSQHFCPEIAVVTNLAPDHFDWHSGYDDYVAAKAKIAAHLTTESLFVLPADLSGFAEGCPAQRMLVSTTNATIKKIDVMVEDSSISVTLGRKSVSVPVRDLWAKMPYRINAGLAAGVCLSTGVSASAAEQGFEQFSPLDYRFKAVDEIEGVAYVNDSKATNLHALVSSVKACSGDVHLLVGGKNKNLDWDSVKADLDDVVAAYAFGESAEIVRDAWGDIFPVSVFETMGDALKAAHSAASSGSSVLLAPGTSSFDQFSSYEERGRRYDLLVKALKTGGR